MSISGALNAAVTGLSASSRAAELVAANVANASTEGYGRREIALQSSAVSPGVLVIDVIRYSSPVLTGDRRLAEASAVDKDVRADFLRQLEQAIGTPEGEGSLGARIAAFDAALIEAASRPESEARLSTVANAAQALTRTFADISGQIQTARTQADRSVAYEVEGINTALRQVQALNVQIQTFQGSRRDPSALLDQRQVLVDKIASAIPLREVKREGGQIALLTTGGAVLLEGRAATLGFVPAGTVAAQSSVANGGLSGLTLDGKPLPTVGADNPIAGGSLSARFAVRDELAVDAQARLDAMARDVMERFQSPGLDPTLAPGSAGLFTDRGQPFNTATETGLSARLAVNMAVDPAAGGALWRLRDGLGAGAPGPAGQSALLTSLRGVLTEPRSPASGGFMPGNRSVSTLAGEMLSAVSSRRVSAEGEASFSQARFTTLKEMELSEGVDTDQELQSLLAIEQSYAANAKVIQSVEEMMKLILGL